MSSFLLFFAVHGFDGEFFLIRPKRTKKSPRNPWFPDPPSFIPVLECRRPPWQTVWQLGWGFRSQPLFLPPCKRSGGLHPWSLVESHLCKFYKTQNPSCTARQGGRARGTRTGCSMPSTAWTCPEDDCRDAGVHRNSLKHFGFSLDYSLESGFSHWSSFVAFPMVLWTHPALVYCLSLLLVGPSLLWC